jgi:hypothetical protein
MATMALSKVRDSSFGSLIAPIAAQPLTQMADKKHIALHQNRMKF